MIILVPRTAVAQVFSTVINLPPDSPPTTVESNTQLNVRHGGTLPTTGVQGFFGFEPLHLGRADGSSENIELNVSGGIVDGSFTANSGSTVSISGGAVDFIRARTGSQVAITGGAVVGVHAFPGSNVALFGGTVDHLTVDSGSDVTVSGGEFLQNGVATTDLAITLSDTDFFTGTLADGSPFFYSPLSADEISGLNLTNALVPNANVNPITVDNDNSPDGLREGQSLTLEEGGVLRRNFSAVNATLNIVGGEAGNGIKVAGSEVNISGGIVGFGFDAFSGSTVIVLGGVLHGSFDAFSGSTVNISGGLIGPVFSVSNGSTANIMGGSFGDRFIAENGSQVTLFGGEFRLNGVAPSVPSVTLAESDVLTGTLKDGSPFIFSPAAFDELNNVTLVAVSLPSVDTTPALVDGEYSSNGLREGQTLTLVNGGILGDYFAAVGATLNIAGGVIGNGLEAATALKLARRVDVWGLDRVNLLED